MECSGFYPPRSEAFPAGLRVLVVDDDPTWLKILEKMLKKCSYEVTTCGLAREALDLLRERKDGFDIVISDVNMPDMDGFKLLERVGLELDLPVIMMSVDGETSRVMKGVQHGACDYLLKPIRMKELKNIWQHVLRKRIHEVKETDSDGLDEIQMMSGNPSEYANDYYSFSMGDICSGKKRKKDAESKHDDKEYSDTSSIKKPRVVWTVDLHQKFVKAVNHIGFDKVGPKKILDLMGVPWLTRENVASHLQKYRLYLSRLQKDGEIEDTSFLGVMGAEVPPREVAEKVLLQNPINAQQNDVRNANCGTSGNKSQMPSSDVTPADSVPSQYLWTAEYPQIQHKQDSKSRFHHLPPKAQQHEQVNTVPASSYFSFRHENRKEDNLADLQVQEIREAPQQFGRTPSPTWSIKYGTSSAGSFLLDEQFDMRSIGVPSGSALSSNVIQGVHNVGFNGGESFEGIDPELLAAPLYESLKFDYEYSFDTMEYPVLDQSLFIV